MKKIDVIANVASFMFLLTPAAFAQTPEAAAPATGASTMATAETSAPRAATDAGEKFDNVSDFGTLDLEMATVSDFNQLDLSALLDAQVETASKKSEPISRAPAIIEILTRQQLYDLGARDLYTALTFLPGIELTESYNGVTTLVFRGQLEEIYNAKILMLINGHPAYEAVNSTFYLELIPLEAIDRIEVIRGPGSVLYGTNAFAGVINVITQVAREDGNVTSLRAEGGSFRTLAGGGGNRGRIGDFAWGAYVGVNNSKGYPYVIETNQNEDCTLAEPPRPADCVVGRPSATIDYFNNFVSTLGDLHFEGLRLQGAAMIQQREKFGIIPATRYSGYNDAQHMFGDLSYRHEWDTFSILIRGGVDSNYRVWRMGHFPYPNFPEAELFSQNYIQRAELNTSWTPIESLTLDQGLSFERAYVSRYEIIQDTGSIHPLSPAFEGEPDQKTMSWYGQGTWKIVEPLRAVAGVRVSRFQTVTNLAFLDKAGVQQANLIQSDPIVNNSPRGGLIYAPIDEFVIKVLYGAAFRTPNLYETNAVLNQIVGISRDIKPETVRTAELGIDSRPHERVSLRANIYNSLTDRRIARREPTTEEAALFGAASTVYDNLPGQRSIGAEASMTSIITEQWSLFANAGVKQVRDRKTKKIVRETAPLTANAGVAYKPFSWLAVRPNGQYIGPRNVTKAYTLANLVVDFPVTEAITLSAIGTNLGDTQYTHPEYVRQVVKTLPGGPGRAFYGRVVAEF